MAPGWSYRVLDRPTTVEIVVGLDNGDRILRRCLAVMFFGNMNVGKSANTPHQMSLVGWAEHFGNVVELLELA